MVSKNGNNIKFWYDNWLEESALIYKINPNIENLISKQAKVGEFISPMKQQNIILLIFS